MSTAATEIRPYNPSLAPAPRTPAVSQATAIEQQRAIAEVQAAVVVAQNCPRDMAGAEAEMEYVCGRMDMAEQAFYQVTNRGTDASVHLMRELARIWGNVQFGVNELHRSDEKGESEVQAWAWDMQRNTRSSRTFIVPHQRMAKVNGVKQRVDLTDLGDIYLNNQNVGARAVRECIATIVPRWFTQKAKDICHNTLENGEGEPLKDRIVKMVSWFDQMGVTEKQLEARIGKKRGQWEANDLAQMKIAGKSIKSGEISKDEVFPPGEAESSAADEIVAAEKTAEPEEATHVTQQETRDGAGDTDAATTEVEETTASPDPGQQLVAGDTVDEADLTSSPDHPARKKLIDRMFALLNKVGLADDAKRDDRLIVTRAFVKRDDIDSSSQLTDRELAAFVKDMNAAGRNLGDEVGEILNLADLSAENAAQQDSDDGGQGSLV